MSAIVSSRALLALTLLFTLLYLADLGLPRDLWVQDEARYGEVVREMLVDGHWLIPHLNGHPYPDKPPVYFWLVAAVGALVGQGEGAFRLVSVLATALAAAGVWRVARELFDTPTAHWSAALFLSTLLTLVVGHINRMDMPLTAAAVWAWYALLRRHAGGSAASLAGFWLGCALTVAFKGPIGLLFTVCPALVWLVLEERRSLLKTLRPFLGLAALALAVAGWIAAVWAAGQGAYLERIWNEQLVGRAVKSWSHREPFWFYLALLPLLLMPWTGLVVAGGAQLRQRRDSAWRTLATFALVPLVALSAVSGKLFIYLEPLIPALAVAGGLAAARLAGVARVPLAIALAPALFCAMLAAAFGWAVMTRHEIAPIWSAAMALGFALIAGAGLVLARSGGRTWLVGWLVASVALNALLFGALAQMLDPAFSARALGRYVAEQAHGGEVGVVHTTRGILNYYAGRRFTEVALGDAAAWHRAHPDALLIVQAKHARQIVARADDCAINRSFDIEFKTYRVLGTCPR